MTFGVTPTTACTAGSAITTNRLDSAAQELPGAGPRRQAAADTSVRRAGRWPRSNRFANLRLHPARRAPQRHLDGPGLATGRGRPRHRHLRERGHPSLPPTHDPRSDRRGLGWIRSRGRVYRAGGISSGLSCTRPRTPRTCPINPYRLVGVLPDPHVNVPLPTWKAWWFPPGPSRWQLCRRTRGGAALLLDTRGWDSVARSGFTGSPVPAVDRHVRGEEFGATMAEVLACGYGVGAHLGPADDARARRHFAITVRFEWMFWDAAWRLEEWPLP